MWFGPCCNCPFAGLDTIIVAMSVELILAGNGPGELRGWMMPIAHAARARQKEQDQPTRLTVVLTPSQFATGREADVIGRWGLFDRILDVPETLRVMVGLSSLTRESHAVVVHLGGDLWFSGRLARRLGVKACAMSESTLIAARHGGFARIFAASSQIASALRARGVPVQKILTTGDPRADTILDGESGREQAAGYTVSFLPGSRDRIFEVMAPYFLAVAAGLAGRIPALNIQMVTSEFLSPTVIASMQQQAAAQWPDLRVNWVTDVTSAALLRSDVVMTIPGTNTLELAYLAVPFAVVVELGLLHRAPLEGAAEWLSRIPVLGPPLRQALLERFLRRTPYVSLPNMRAGRALVPEWVGRWAPDDLTKRLADLLADGKQRMTIRRELQKAFGGSRGASRVIVETAVGLALTETPA